MVAKGYPVRNDNVVWRNVAGEVVIAERDDSKIHVLNGTASLIWSMADGTKQIEDMVAAICKKERLFILSLRVSMETNWVQL